MSSPRFEPGSFMTERERSANWAINHWQFYYKHSLSVIIVFSKTLLSLNSNRSTNLVELLKVSRVWWIAIYKSTILIHKHRISLLSLLEVQAVLAEFLTIFSTECSTVPQSTTLLIYSNFSLSWIIYFEI
jgi:hypothetical protein